jgi:hypothetical protein
MSTDLTLPAAGLDTADADQVAAFTRALVGAAFQAENTTRQADRDPTALSMSGIGGCLKQAAHSVARSTPTDVAPPEEAREAVLGTWIHDHLIPWMVRLARGLGLDAVGEEPCQVTAGGLVIPGTSDFAVPEIVWDIKSVKEWRLHGVRRHGVYLPHELQVGGYALARWQSGHPVKWVVWIYIDRSTGEVHIEVKEFTNQLALAVVDRLTRIRYHAANPDLAAREGRGPGISLACDRCPWLRRCWGPTAVPGKPGAQTILAATPAGIEQALALYARAAAAAGAADKDKEFAKAVLADTPRGQYGAWTLDYGKPGSTTDTAQVADDYDKWGRTVPKKPTAGRIMVKPAPQREE